MTNYIAYTYNTVYSYAIQAPFTRTRIRFHRETLLFCSVSADCLTHKRAKRTWKTLCLENAFQSGSFQKRDTKIIM